MATSVFGQAVGYPSPQRPRSNSTDEATAVLQHYDVGRTIGEGGFAKVKIATHKLTGVEVAIKIVETKHLSQADAARLHHEIAALKKLHHQHICQLYEVHHYDTRIYMTLELAKNGELFDYIVTKKRLRETEAREIFRQVAKAVAYCHERKIVHRDLKPENILLDEKGNVKLVDFGLVAALGSDQDFLQTCCGSPAYAAPELIRGEKYVGTKADMWSLGVLLYALLCGYLPFDHENVNELYKLIVRGKFDVPPSISKRMHTCRVSGESRAMSSSDYHTKMSVDVKATHELLKKLLAVEPEERLSIHELLNEKWMYIGYEHKGLLTSESMLSTDIDTEIVHEISRYTGRPASHLAKAIIDNTKKDHDVTIYHLLMRRKLNGHPIALGPPNVMVNKSQNERTPSRAPDHANTTASKPIKAGTSASAALYHPVLFGSLGVSMPTNLAKIGSASNKRPSPVNIATTPTSVSHKRPSIDNHFLSKSYDQGLHILDSYGNTKIPKEGVSAQPSHLNSLSSDWFPSFKNDRSHSLDAGPFLSQMRPENDSKFDSVGNGSRDSLDIDMGDSRPSRRSTFDNLTASLRNVFNPPPSPKGSRYAPRVVRDTGFSTDTTSLLPPKVVLQAAMKVLVHNEVQISQKEPFLLYCVKKRHDNIRASEMIWELEICKLEHMGITGVVFRRVKGEVWQYKHVVDTLLQQLTSEGI